MAGQHTIWDHSLNNAQGSTIEGGRAVSFGVGAEQCVLPAGAGVSNFAGISTHVAADGKPLAVRRLGSVLVKASGNVAMGAYAKIAGTDGRIMQCAESGTPTHQWAVGIFEESGVNNDLVVMTVIYPAMQVML